MSLDPAPRWRDVAVSVGLVDPDGAVRPTVFAEMSALAAGTGAINLGQGFPDADGLTHVATAAIDAIRAGHNQYPPGDGAAELRRGVAVHQRRHYGIELDWRTEVLVTTGATEGVAAAVLALVGPGDEVVVVEPYYDAYAAVVAMAGARLVGVPLTVVDGRFRLDADALLSAVGDRTRMLLINSPHNPTGTVLTPDDLAVVAEIARERDLVVVTDEVYEHLTYDGAVHTPVSTLPGMAERTLSVSSAGKSLSFTGWKIGWVTGPAALVTAVRTVKQYLSYVSGAPFQPAIAAALLDEEGWTAEYLRRLRASLAARRDLLCAGLADAGFEVVVPSSTYFVVADGRALCDDAIALCRELPARAGVVAVPVTAFCAPGSAVATQLQRWVRFTFVKHARVLVEAIHRLRHLKE